MTAKKNVKKATKKAAKKTRKRAPKKAKVEQPTKVNIDYFREKLIPTLNLAEVSPELRLQVANMAQSLAEEVLVYRQAEAEAKK